MNSTDIKSNEIVNENQPEKRAKGRPLTSRDGQKRTSRLTVLCSKEELERFNNLANNYGLSASQMTHKLFEMDRAAIEDADALVVLYYGNYSDTGTAWECGYAFAKGKPVILVYVDADADSNLMMHCGCRANISLQDLKDYDFDTMPRSEYEGKML